MNSVYQINKGINKRKETGVETGAGVIVLVVKK